MEGIIYSSGDARALPQLEVQTQQNHPRHPMYTKDKWAQFQNTIRELYVDQNNTIQEVIKYLQENYDFNPTRKQFLTKIKKWHFEKNVKKKDLPQLLGGLSLAVHTAVSKPRTIRGRRVDKAKIKRWEKRAATSSCTTGVKPQEGQQPPLNQRAPDPPIFNPYRYINIVDSPGLTGLIGALSLETYEEIPPLDLSTEHAETASEMIESLLLNSDLAEHTTQEATQPEDAIEHNSNAASSSSTLALVSCRTNQHALYHSNPAKGKWTPLNEIYPFPVTSSTKLGSIRHQYYWPKNGPTMTELECTTKLSNMEYCTKSELLELADEMWHIAGKYGNDLQHRVAETWYRRIISVKQLAPGMRCLETLEAALMLVEVMKLTGRHLQAEPLAVDLHTKLQHVVGSQHVLTLFSKELLSHIVSELGNNEEGLKYALDRLQICLVAFGVRHEETIEAMSDLGFFLTKQSRYLESADLLHITLQLLHPARLEPSSSTIIDQGFDTMLNLARLHLDRKEPAVGGDILQEVHKQYSCYFSSDPRMDSEYHRQLAELHELQGNLSASEEVYRALLRRRGPFISPDVLSVICGRMADISWENGRRDEALTWRVREYDLTRKIYGHTHRYCMWTCEELGDNYTDVGRYDDALHHFEHAIEQLDALKDGKSGASAEKCIEKVQAWKWDVQLCKDASKQKDLAIKCKDRRNYDDAISHYQQAIEKLVLLKDGEYSSWAAERIEELQGWIAEIRGRGDEDDQQEVPVEGEEILIEDDIDMLLDNEAIALANMEMSAGKC